MKTILFFLAMMSSQLSLACDGILYRYEAKKPHSKCTKIAPETYCCIEGNDRGEYYNGSYHYPVRMNRYNNPPEERVCTTRTVCVGGGSYFPAICGPQTACEN
jgi:hypothetical protein